MSRLKIFFPLSLLLVPLMLMPLSAKPPILTMSAPAQNEESYEVIFTIPIGEDGVHYEGAGIPEMLTWGPAAFTVASDGSFWIADTVGDRLLRYSPAGNLLDKSDLKGLAVGVTDIEVASYGIWVLDQASMPPTVLTVGEDGTQVGMYDLTSGLQL